MSNSDLSNMVKCPICGQMLKKGNAHHIKHCIDNYVSTLSYEEKQKYINLYNNGMSIYELSILLKFSHKATKRFLKSIGITSFRTDKLQKLTNHTKLKYKDTCLLHFGLEHNFCKNSPSRISWESRLYEQEGIVNVFLRDSVKQKIKNTLIEHYGNSAYNIINSKEHYFEKWKSQGFSNDDCVKKYNELCFSRGNSMRLSYYIEKYGNDNGYNKYVDLLQKRVNISNNKSISSLNKKMYTLLDDLHIEYEKEYCIETEIKGKFLYYDIKIRNFIFELNGDYWHASPTKYKKDDIIKYPNNYFCKASDIWDKDKYKKDVAELNGYTVYYIWEHDINNPETWEFIKKCFNLYAEIENNRN